MARFPMASRLFPGILTALLLAGPTLAEGLPRSARAPAPPGLGQASSHLVLPVIGPVQEASALLGARTPAGLPPESYLKVASTPQAAYEVYDRQGKLLGTLQGQRSSGALRFLPTGG